MSRRSRAVVVVLRLVVAALGLGTASPAQAQVSGRFHLVRSTSGSRGAPDGSRFIMEDPRSEFQAGKDRQVLVTFEWQGPIGHHRCEGTWKDPSGRAVFTSQSELDARVPRFGVYWGLSLPDVVATGNWIVEARIDGEAAGVHVFQILAGPVPQGPAAPKALSVAELYQRGLTQTLTLDVLDGKGGPLGRTSGFFLSPTVVLTSFSGINAAHSVRLLLPGAAPIETSEVLSWNRRDDWAMLRFSGATGQAPAHPAAPLQVGDRCFFLDAQGEAGRAIVETTIVGRTPDGDLLLGETASAASDGGPVLNEFGEVVATLAGSRLLGGSAVDEIVTPRSGVVRGTRARPVPPSTHDEASARTLDDLLKTGVFVRQVVHTPHFISGVLGTGMEVQNRIPVATDQRFLFRRTDGKCVVFLTFTPRVKEDAMSIFALYDEDNRRVGASKERKLSLRVGQSFVLWWEIALPPLRPGTYRVDLLKGEDPIFRSFFRLTD